MARIIRKGSSEKVISGSKGVLIILSAKSATPLNGSIKAPKLSGHKLIANALMVKSRLF